MKNNSCHIYPPGRSFNIFLINGSFYTSFIQNRIFLSHWWFHVCFEFHYLFEYNLKRMSSLFPILLCAYKSPPLAGFIYTISYHHIGWTSTHIDTCISILHCDKCSIQVLCTDLYHQILLSLLKEWNFSIASDKKKRETEYTKVSA